MSVTVRAGFNFCGEQFVGTLQIPDRYVGPDGKILERELIHRFSAHPNIGFKQIESTPEAESKPDPQVEKLTAAVQELISVNRSLLKKLEEQSVSLTVLAKFVWENSSNAPTFGVMG